MMKTVNAKQMAIFLGLDSERRVQQLVKEGMPKEAHGKYDPMRCLVWRVRDLQKKLDGKITANGDPSTATVPWPSFSGSAQVMSLVPPQPQIETTFATNHHCAFWAAG